MSGLTLLMRRYLLSGVSWSIEWMFRRSTWEERSRNQKERRRNARRRMEEELKIEGMKLEMKKENENKGIIVNRNIQLKLPKLHITKFEGTHLNSFWFWNQFETKTDDVKIIAISKFSYLKEFLVVKLRALIDGLPFTPERYAREQSLFSQPSLDNLVKWQLPISNA